MTVTFHPRASLGLVAPVPARLRARTTAERTTQHVGITGHHVGDGGELSHPNPITRLQNIATYHVHVLGYGDIAYHGAFDAGANTYGLRDTALVGAHAGSFGNVANRLTDGIVFLEDARGWTEGAQMAWSWWCDLSHYAYRRVPVLYGHHWWSEGHGGTGTVCPAEPLTTVIRHAGGYV